MSASADPASADVGPPGEESTRPRVAGVIGRPIAHSLSPVIHNAAFAAVGLDWIYRAFDVGADETADFIARAAADGFGGLNVTMPDKEAAAVAVDRLTPDAEVLGAVNTVVFGDGGTLGDTTDGPGFLDALVADVSDFDVAGARVAVVGAGGAARAVVLALGRAAAADIAVINRTPSRAEESVRLAPGTARVADESAIPTADLVVHATPVGMGDDHRLPFDADLIQPGQLVCDLIYWPAETPLLRAAGERQARAVNGLGMLVHQAARAFTLWTSVPAPIEAMTAAAGAELARRG